MLSKHRNVAGSTLDKSPRMPYNDHHANTSGDVIVLPVPQTLLKQDFILARKMTPYATLDC